MEVSDKQVLVVGLGKSGLSAARWLSRMGARVVASDLRAYDELGPEVVAECKERGITLESGVHHLDTFLNAETIIVSPGIPLDIEPLRAAQERGIPILGELELASRLIDIPMVAVTGTNGKSTVVSFIGWMMEQAGIPVFLGGNIGTPLMEYIQTKSRADYAVVEVSSFQLDTAVTFSPYISVILNITPDHLDRYPNYEAYVRSKLRISRRQGLGQYAIWNDDDARLAENEPPGSVTLMRYGSGPKAGRYAYLSGRSIRISIPGEKVQEFKINRSRLPGGHNLENMMASILAGCIVGLDVGKIQEAVDGFSGLPHRLEWVRSLGQIDFYNDSKATNVDAALRAVQSFDRPVILIAGGRHKGADYAPLIHAGKGIIRHVILIGESQGLMAAAFDGHIPVVRADGLEEAVSRAYGLACPHDAVLLSPACSSFDMFTDYVHRGEVFKETVKQLRHGS